MKKRMLCLFLLLALGLTGCARVQAEGKIQIVAAIFPEYDWVRQIVGEDASVEITLLVDDGVDPHSFQPSVADMVTASQCDLLIYGGGESDSWLQKLLQENGASNQKIISLLPLLGENTQQEETVEGMQAEESDGAADEHVWLSLRNAELFCTAIADALCELNPESTDIYQTNLESYLQKLEALDDAYTEAVKGAVQDTIVVCDRFPFRYLVEDYGLNYYAAFLGCSAETGASFETVVFLADKVKELDLSALLVTETSDGELPRAVAENAGRTDIPVLTLNAMQAISGESAEGTNYLTIMEENLAVLKQALN